MPYYNNFPLKSIRYFPLKSIREQGVGTVRCGAGSLTHGNTAAGPPLPHDDHLVSEEVTNGKK